MDMVFLFHIPFRILRIEEIETIARVATSIGIRSVRLTGGEPLVRKGVVDLVAALKDMPGIENISMTTNGVLLPQMANDLKSAGLSRVNISLDTLDYARRQDRIYAEGHRCCAASGLQSREDKCGNGP